MGKILYECCMRKTYGTSGWADWDAIGPVAQSWFNEVGSDIQREMNGSVSKVTKQ